MQNQMLIANPHTMTTSDQNKSIVEEVSWNIRKDIQSITGAYDTVITNKIEKYLLEALQSKDLQTQQAVEAGIADKKRLDFLDECNRRLNSYYGTTYGWKLILNHNVTRLMSGHLAIDLNDANCGSQMKNSCRDAIDAEVNKITPKDITSDNT